MNDIKITDERFIAAMRQVVKEQGENHVAPGVYQSKGEAYCIIGTALASIDKRLCPKNNLMLAEELLRHHGCSLAVAMAAHAAQYANDTAMRWGEVLEVFVWGLKNWRDGMDKERFIHQAVYLSPSRQAARAAMTAAQKEALVDYLLDPNPVFPTVTYAGDKPTFAASMLVASEVQKDFALIA